MTKGISGDEPDARKIYGDIIDLPHHQSAKHKHMSLYDRAAQFAPFAALTGYDDMVAEEARLTDSGFVLSEASAARLDRTLAKITDALSRGTHPEVLIEYFIPDPYKDGGRYETVTDRVYTVDTAERAIVLVRKEGRAGLRKSIPLDRILELRLIIS